MAGQAAELLVKVSVDDSGFHRGMAGVERSIGSFAKVGAGLAVGAVGGIAAALGLAVNAAGNFEQTLNTLQAVTGATGEQMDKVKAVAKALGNDMSLPATSAADAAVAMTELAKGGLSVKEAMAAAKGVLQMSAAAQISNADAATITARALNSFGLAGKEAIRVADVLANAANASTGEVSDFAYGLQQSSAVAHQMGLTLEQTTAALMELSDAGIVGSDAGTSLKTMLQRLVPSTDKAANLMRQLGIDVFDSHGKFVGIEKAIGRYQRGLAKLNPEQRMAAMNTLFGSDAIRAANVILGQGTAKYQEYLEKTQRSGAAAELAAAKTKGFKGALEGFKSVMETVAINVGEKLLPMLTDAFQRLGAWINENMPAIEQAVSGAFEVVRAVVERVMPIIRGVVETFAALLQGDWAGVWDGVKTTVVETGKLVFDATKALGKLAWDGLKAGTSRIVDWMSDKMSDLVDAIRDRISAAYGAAVKWGSSVLKGVISGVADLVGWVRGKVQDGVDAVTDRITAAYTASMNFGKKILSGVKDGVLGVVDWIRDTIGDGIDAVRSFFDRAFNAASSLGGRIKSGVVDGVTGIVNSVRDFISDIPGAISSFAGAAWSAAKALGGKIIDGLGDALSSLGQKMVGWIKAPINAVIGAWNNTGLPSFKIHIPLPGPVPDIDFSTPSITLPDIPFLGDGGIVSKPTLAMIGERGPEAVIPLSRGFGAGIGPIPTFASSGAGRRGSTYNVTVIVNGSVQTERDLVSAIKQGLRQDSRRSGSLFSAAPGVTA